MNPKGIALFLSATARAGHGERAAGLRDLLLHLRSPDSIPCWGYDFPWQARAFALPAATPTVVATAFAIEALLDLDDAVDDPDSVALAAEACRFFLERLHRTDDATGTCLSYSPRDRTAVYNASLLAARALVRVSVRTGERGWDGFVQRLVSFALARQREDGAWVYGTARHHRFIDSLHTGFVLGALDVHQRASRDIGARDAVLRGAAYYARTFFGPAGEPYYFAHRRYPYDVHSAAQAVLTFLQLRDLVPGFDDAARKTGMWMLDHLFDPAGFFGYQVHRTHRVMIPFMRWSQAWGCRALAELVRRDVAGGRP